MVKQKLDNTIIIKELNIEVEKNIHDLGKDFNYISKNIPFGWRLLTIMEIIFLFDKYKSKLQMDKYYEFFEQPSEKNKKQGLAAIRDGNSGLNLDLNWGPSNANPYLGVRFCRDLKKVKI